MRWEVEVASIKNIFQETDLEVHHKWGTNLYYHNQEMILALRRFKNHFRIWFYKGAFLQDIHG